jgi:hypothetical protein
MHPRFPGLTFLHNLANIFYSTLGIIWQRSQNLHLEEKERSDG